MAAKRFLDDSDQDKDKPSDKRMRTPRTSFASVIGEVVMVKNLQNLFSGLEPLLRRVVNEEVDRVMRHCCPRSITRSPSLRIQALEQPSSFQLMFNKKLSLPIFTGSRILDIDNNPIHVVLVDKSVDQIVPTSLPHPIKLEIVVLDGDFPAGDKESWTSEEFNNHIVKERTGKRPLLTGELNLTMRDGIAPIEEIEFTDNSSWIRSRKFRVAVRVAPGSNPSVRICEGMTEPFVVKDHRGELYKKHHPPMLQDEVWRLEKIGKDGAFHKKLSSEGITTVQDFLKLSVVDTHRLRKILGIGMSDKMWDVTMKHARTCNMGNKLYIYRGPHFTIFLNAICQLVRADINGQNFAGRELTNMNRSYIEKLVREAYARWNNLEEIDEVLKDNVALLTQGETVEQLLNNHQGSVTAYDENEYYDDKSREGGIYNAQMGCSEWPVNATFATSSFVNGIPYSFSESQSDGDITPPGSGSVIDGGGAPRWH
ncbi:protein SAR DEFICIENT 1-like [Gastrolobium bilobum]|uniref:protein SAR DEFICIENT 1-like n=1 Tax=Gastrolobium bilobum TaxID=150636 RepID=UPI002AB1BBC8|nr:protein SAR DEFICIENT 1-like [Gastrolobium bilobum]